MWERAKRTEVTNVKGLFWAFLAFLPPSFVIRPLNREREREQEKNEEKNALRRSENEREVYSRHRIIKPRLMKHPCLIRPLWESHELHWVNATTLPVIYCISPTRNNNWLNLSICYNKRIIKALLYKTTFARPKVVLITDVYCTVSPILGFKTHEFSLSG